MNFNSEPISHFWERAWDANDYPELLMNGKSDKNRRLIVLIFTLTDL